MIDFLEAAQELNAVEVRKHEVGDDHIRAPLFEDFLAAGADEGGSNLVPLCFDDHLQPFGHRRLIVNGEDPFAALAVGRKLTCHTSRAPDAAARMGRRYVCKSYRHRDVELKHYML